MSAGDHIVHFYYASGERRDVQTPFLVEGLRAGQRCVVLRPETEGAELERALSEEGIAVDDAIASGQLILHSGRSSVADLERMLHEAVDGARDRFEFVRWCGDMTWTFDRIATSDVLMEWESACNVVGSFPIVFLCQYDLNLFSGDIVIDALRTHPLAIIGNAIHQSPYYQSPEDFLEALRSRGTEPTVRS